MQTAQSLAFAILKYYPRFVSRKTSSEKNTPAKKAVRANLQPNKGMLIGYARVSTQDQNFELPD